MTQVAPIRVTLAERDLLVVARAVMGREPFAFVEHPDALAAQLAASLRAMAAAAHDVGEHFPQEARKVHAGASEHRSIRGRASRDEVEALIDEGIPILPVPPAKDDLH